jgi:hypothetical protein
MMLAAMPVLAPPHAPDYLSDVDMLANTVALEQDASWTHL